MIRSMMETFSDNLLIGTPSSLMTTKLNLVNNASSGLAPIEFSQVGFHFELCALKSLINNVLYYLSQRFLVILSDFRAV